MRDRKFQKKPIQPKTHNSIPMVKIETTEDKLEREKRINRDQDFEKTMKYAYRI